MIHPLDRHDQDMITGQELNSLLKREGRAVLLVNTSSRKGRRLFFDAVNLLTSRGIHLAAQHQVPDPAQISVLARQEIERGCRLIIVGGGDGTVSSLVDVLAYRDVILGLLPLGTANSFARSLEIPLAIDKACDVIVKGRAAGIDLGKVNGDYFANMASIGFTADVAKRTPRWLKRVLGHTAYLLTGIGTFFATQRFQCDLTADGSRRRVATHLVIVANGSFFGVMNMYPESRIGNRQLFVLTMDMMSRWELLVLWFAFIFRKYRRLAAIRYFTTKQVTIETDPPLEIDIDGEPSASTPVTISLAPNALMMMLPGASYERT